MGGSLSIAQQVTDSVLAQDGGSSIFGNPVKVGLGAVSILFDFVFIFQHYCLYTRSRDVELVFPRLDEEDDGIDERTPISRV